jgi:hypothetical protein
VQGEKGAGAATGRPQIAQPRPSYPLWTTAALIISGFVAEGAVAQDIDSIGSQIDFVKFRDAEVLRPADSPVQSDVSTTDRVNFSLRTPVEPLAADPAGPPPPPPPSKRFTFSIGAPFTYTTNALKADTGLQDDVHFSPLARLAWEKPFGDITVGASLTLNYDEYVRLADADQSLILGNIQAVLGDQSERLAPYVAYAPSFAFLNLYDDHAVTLHDFTVGLRRKKVLDKTAAGEARTLISIDLSYTRREASLAASEQHRPTLVLGLIGVITPTLSWVLKPQLQGRFSTGGVNEGREDLNLKLLGGIEWQPRDSTGKVSAGKVAVNIVFERNESNRPGRDYSLWDIGPSISTTWKF